MGVPLLASRVGRVSWVVGDSQWLGVLQIPLQTARDIIKC